MSISSRVSSLSSDTSSQMTDDFPSDIRELTDDEAFVVHKHKRLKPNNNDKKYSLPCLSNDVDMDESDKDDDNQFHENNNEDDDDDDEFIMNDLAEIDDDIKECQKKKEK